MVNFRWRNRADTDPSDPRGIASCGGDDESIQQAEIDLHRLQHIESAALLALRLDLSSAALWARSCGPHTTKPACRRISDGWPGATFTEPA